MQTFSSLCSGKAEIFQVKCLGIDSPQGIMGSKCMKINQVDFTFVTVDEV